MKKKKKTPAKKAKAKSAGAGVRLELDVKLHGLEPVLGAAYALGDRAVAKLSGDRAKTLTLTLEPKPGTDAAGLETLFWDELQVQKLRWSVAKNNLPVRERIAHQAVLAAAGKLPETGGGAPSPAPKPEEELTAEQKDEISRLIAEVEEEIADLKSKKGLSDPKNIAATWEEKHREK